LQHLDEVLELVKYATDKQDLLCAGLVANCGNNASYRVCSHESGNSVRLGGAAYYNLARGQTVVAVLGDDYPSLPVCVDNAISAPSHQIYVK